MLNFRAYSKFSTINSNWNMLFYMEFGGENRRKFFHSFSACSRGVFEKTRNVILGVWMMTLYDGAARGGGRIPDFLYDVICTPPLRAFEIWFFASLPEWSREKKGGDFKKLKIKNFVFFALKGAYLHWKTVFYCEKQPKYIFLNNFIVCIWEHFSVHTFGYAKTLASLQQNPLQLA